MEFNSRGIPKAPFVDAVEKFIDGSDVEGLLQKFNETMAKYKRMEASVLGKKKNLSTKLPELKKALDAATLFLQKSASSSISSEKPMELQFELSESLYATAKITNVDKVCVWLGANVMLEYPLAEAVQLLQTKYGNGQKSFQIVNEDLEYLREQITTMEVNIARVYNYDVKLRREAKMVAAAQ